ncbi:SCO6880 family protein, partial [Frankia sp. Cas4]|uniref:SCO6880 family protein n=1 Tax=Frankia sp. Cas4 TaxID=3073927 RepID=UPI002AD3C72B
VDARRLRHSGITAQDAAIAAARPLAERCTAAGLVVDRLLSPVDLAQTVRLHADPTARTGLDGVRRGLAAKAGLAATVDPALLAPLAIHAHWDAVQIDGGWHRLFWIAHWPTLTVQPGWLDPLLHDTPGARTVAVLMEPVPPRISRRRLNTESVSVDAQLHLRQKHAVRVPVHLTQAHEDIDRRDAELQAGYPEYGYAGLIDVTAPSRPALDEASQAMVDLAARCGIAELRPLHGRHDRAWAATLPLGLAPGRGLFGGGG